MVFPANFWILFSIFTVVLFIAFWKGIANRMLTGVLIITIGLSLLLLFWSSITIGTFLCCLMLIAFGTIWFIHYSDNRFPIHGLTEFLAYLVSAPLLAAMSVLQISSLFYHLNNDADTNLWVWIGIAVMAIGLYFQIKAIHKPSVPIYKKAFNIFFIGVFISGIGSVSGIGQWIVVLLGLAITLIMTA